LTIEETNEYLATVGNVVKTRQGNHFGDFPVLDLLIKNPGDKFGEKYEKDVELLLDEAGYTKILQEVFLEKQELTKRKISKLAKSLRKGTLNICQEFSQGNYYISQPCSTHQSPDILLISDGKVLSLELKTTRHQWFPVMNSGRIHDRFFYLCKLQGHIFYFLGKNLPYAPNWILDIIEKAMKLAATVGKVAIEKWRGEQPYPTIPSNPYARAMWNMGSFLSIPVSSWIKMMEEPFNHIDWCE